METIGIRVLFFTMILDQSMVNCLTGRRTFGDLETSNGENGHGHGHGHGHDASTGEVSDEKAKPGVAFDATASKTDLRSAIVSFQKFMRLPITGELDTKTRQKMTERRCGVPDVGPFARDATQSKWKKDRLTWTITQLTGDLPETDQRRALKEAFSVWSQVTPLEFVEVDKKTKADIRVQFAKRQHGDAWPFDGPGGVLAHATLPPGGELHFDDDENWVYMNMDKLKQYEYIDVLAVAVHEIGHLLGLSHSRHETSIMIPQYQKTVDEKGNYHKPTLDRSDIGDAQEMYGVRGGKGPTSTDSPSIPNQKPSPGDRGGNRQTSTGGSACLSRARLDALTVGTNARGYLFSDDQVYEIRGDRFIQRSPITEIFPKGPSRVDAALTNSRSSTTLLFNQRQVYSYTWNDARKAFELNSDFPKTITMKVPFIPSGAFVWVDGHQILISDTQFAVYDENWNEETMVNKLSAYFPDFPHDQVKAALIFPDSHARLFTSDTVYQYDTKTKKLRKDTAKPLLSYFKC